MEAVLEWPVTQFEDDLSDFVTTGDRECAHKQYIRERLAEAAVYAARSDAKWYTADEVIKAIKEKHSL
ncbi:hypothetical protein ACYULU_05975 [Breznakiellaceae bacterium SP9]